MEQPTTAPATRNAVQLEVVPCWDMDIMDILGYHNISYLINASIYLVKGGRLSLLPGVLFHSCRPSYCHNGVMFLDFCVPNTVRVYGPLLTVHFE